MYNRIKSLNFRHFAIVGLAVLCCTLLPSSVHAVDMSPNVHPIWTNASPDCTYYDSNGLTYFNDLYNGTTNFLSISYINCAVPEGLQSNKTYAVYSFILDNIPDNNSLDAGFRAVKARHGSGGDGGWGVVGVDISSIANNGAKVDIYLYGEKSNTTAGTVTFFNPYNANELFYIEPTERITTSGASYWQIDTTDFEYNYTDVLNAISGKLDTANTHLQNIRRYVYDTNESVKAVGRKIDDLKSVQEQANDDANDRYQDEKDTTYDEAQDGSDSMSGAFSMPNIANPLTGWLSLFTDNCSVSIPTLASWLHAPSNRYTNWWCSSQSLLDIRYALTGVLSVTGVLLVFGFAFKWLRTNNGED